MSEIEKYLLAIIILNIIELSLLATCLIFAIRYAIRHDYVTGCDDTEFPVIKFTETNNDDTDNSEDDRYYTSASGRNI